MITRINIIRGKHLLLLAMALTGGSLAKAQRLFTVSELKKDFSVVKAALKEAHAGIYRYSDKVDIENHFVFMEKGINRPMTEQAFFRYLNPFIATIKDGHTKFHREGRPDDLFAFAKTGYFPLKLYFYGNKAYVRSDTVNGRISAGAEITSINGRPVKVVRDLIFKNIFVDGKGNTMKYALINDSFGGYYATFIETSKLFKVGYVDNGQAKTISIAGVSSQNIGHIENLVAPYQLSFPGERIALMRISVFQPGPAAVGFDKFLSESFQAIRNAQISTLLLDLRNNEGGIDAYGIMLYSYLTDISFNYYDRFTVAGPAEYSFSRYAKLPPELEHLKRFIKKVDGEYQFSQKVGLGPQQPNPLNFNGKLIILINGRSFSVTSEFASIAKDNRRAVFIGEDTGGAAGGNTSGAFALVTLPNTKLGLDIPLLGYHMHLKDYSQADFGVKADYQIVPSIKDIMEKNDPVMQKALALSK